jgi:hypothetical protein
MAAQHKPRNPADAAEEEMTRYLAPSAVDRWGRQDVERMQGPRMTPRLAAAYHEAAHAIAAICAERTLDSVEVDDRAAGKCFHRRGPAGDTMEQRLQWIGHEMRIVAAGQEGQRYVDPHGMFRACSSDRTDLENLRLMAEILTGDRAQAEELLDDSRREAGALIDEFWPFVHKIAKALNKRGRLSGAQIREILGLPPKARRPNEEPAKQRARADGYFTPPRAPQTKSVKPSPPILMARVDGGINLTLDIPPPDPRQCEAVTRAFQRRHSGRDYDF